MSETARLQRLVAEVRDDLRQSEEIGRRIVTYEARLAAPGCPPEVAGFVGVLLHRWYTSLEAALERIERVLVGVVPSGEAWHQDLLRLASLEIPDARPAILARATSQALLPYLRFRHFLRHAYAVELDPSKLHGLVAPLPGVQALVSSDLDRFVEETLAAVRSASGDVPA